MPNMTAVNHAVRVLLSNRGMWKVTKYLSPRSIVRATRVRTKGGTIVLTIGRPNYRELEFIKKARKAGMSFPLSGVYWRMIPKKKKR